MKVTFNKQFPRNYRIIPEVIKGINDEIFILIGLGCLLIAIFTIESSLYSNLKEKNAKLNEKQKVVRELGFWEKQIEERPNYRDAYFKLALLNYQLLNITEANKFLKKTLEIDPDFDRGVEFKKMMEAK